jgi:peptide/nickel transport system permease protein
MSSPGRTAARDEEERGFLARFLASDILYSFRRSPMAIGAFVVTLALVLSSAAAPIIAPHSPFDLASYSLLDAELPPAWMEGGDPRFLLGTDTQ